MGLSHLSLLQMSFSGAVFITVIIVLRIVAIDRLPKKMFLVLWGVALLRLLVPLSVPSAVSVYSVVSRNVDADTLEQTPIQNIIPITPEQQGQPGEMVSNTVHVQPVQSEQTDLLQPQQTGGLLPQLSLPSGQKQQIQSSQSEQLSGQSVQISDHKPSVSVWFVVWCSGMVLCAVFFVTFYLRWHFKFSTSVPVHNDYVEQWLEEHELRRPISVRQSDRIAAPLTYGIFRPVILLPNKTDWENTEQLQYVLLHEYVHICRFDTVTKFITAIAVCIHWFNPFVWAMYVLFNRDLELSCDESVVRLLGMSSRSTYARVLISMEARKSGLMPFYNNFSKNAIEKRITSIMKIKKTSLLAIFTAIIVVGGITSVFVTSARSAQGDSGADIHGLTINPQLLPYMDMTYGQFREQTGSTAESYHAHYFQASVPGMEADAVFGGTYDEELGGPILADDDNLIRIEGSLCTIVNGITEEMTAAEFVTAFDEATGALRAIVVNDGGGTAYYVADNYMEIEFDYSGDNLEDALLQIALDESNNVGPDSYTWLVRLDSSAGSSTDTFQSGVGNEAEGYGESLAVFRVDDISATKLRDEFDIEDYYIKNKVIVDNRYYIDEDHVLWGYGRNVYGQLGIGKADELGIIYTEPIKIAENVVSVDCSVNGYFCIYLTADGQLYGIGSNMLGLLGQEYTEAYTVEEYGKVTTPVLLMENVSYARAGREAIVALDKAGSVWWWGQYRATYSTQNNYDALLLYWQATEDESNPMKMFYIHPTKILEHCIYATTGDWSGAAIGQNGELYTWGLNIFGECGTEVTGDDYLRTPTKVLDHVRMVWPEKISFDSTEDDLLEIGRYDTTYHFNMFVQLQDGTMMAAGANLGDKEKTIAITGDLPEPSTSVYSDTFVPIAVEEFSEVEIRKKLQQLTWGMSMEETEDILTQAMIQYYRYFPSETEDDGNGYIVVENSRYSLYFDEDGHLNRILLQEGGSRDGRFTLGMSLSELEKAVEETGGTLTKVESDTPYEIWFYQDQGQQIQYEFFVYEGNVTVVNEMMIKSFESVEPTAVNPDELADIFGISILLPENPNWVVNSEYHLLSKDNLKITYHDTITDSDCVLLVARNENLILPENEYDERLNESWEARTINGQNIVVKVQRGKNESKAVLATWEYNEYRFAIIGEIEGEADSGPIAKVALHIIHDLN